MNECMHDCYLCRFETALQRYCPSCCLPYIDTRLDCWLPRPSDSAVFTDQFLGNNWGPVRTGVAANWRPEPRDCDIRRNGVLTRFTDTGGCWRGLLYTNTKVRRVTGSTSYDRLCQPYTRSGFEVDHGGPHVWIGGHMASLSCAPNDPIFWMHHCFIDMIAEVLKDNLSPAQWYYPRGWVPWRHGANDRMRPFNYNNADGLDDEAIAKEYLYERSPAEERCNTESDCGPVGLLWCDGGVCNAKCRNGGRWDTTGSDAMCYCAAGTPRCNAGVCRC